MHRKPVAQQVVVVVGVASGIGRETALQFAQAGASLVLADNDTEGLSTIAGVIRNSGAAVHEVVADVADRDQVQQIADAAVQRYGRIDTWVHVSAVALYATFMDTTPEEFKRVVDVNLMGQVYGAQAALPHLIASGDGGLICVSSIEAKRALPFHSAYSAAKHGIDAFLEALRLELRKEGTPVHVTQILPASINTPLFDKAATKIGVKPIGVPPLYSPSTVAHAILHAAEDPKRDIVVGGAGKMLTGGQRLSPRLLDEVLLRVGFSSQKTSERRTPDAPNNLFGPANQYNRVDGDFGKMTFSHSLSTWLDLHPAIKAAGLVTLATGAGAAISKLSGSSQQQSPESNRVGGRR
jgi:NAD(P)-dependent dehydrogenase (short-subunit alcohol dehydrogenase family)